MTDNEIYLEFVTGNTTCCTLFMYFEFFYPEIVTKTLSALKATTTAKSVKLKLTKKLSSPCLTFEVDMVTN